MKQHIASQVVMVEPRSFCSNPETAASNAFQNTLEEKNVLQKAQTEFKNFQNVLRAKGIQILSFVEDEKQNTPDALYPNNWFCHLPDGTAIIFPMMAKNRQREIRQDVIQALPSKGVLDLSSLTEQNEFLEGTGSLILDHEQKVAYACLSPRTTARALNIFSEKTGYEVVSFVAQDENAKAIYHTNVMMALGDKVAVVVLSAIRSEIEKQNVIRHLTQSGKTVVDISFAQMRSFAGNMLFLKNQNDKRFWVCSQQAFESLTEENKKTLEMDGEILFAPLTTIEAHGGGGARCLLAEVF